MAYINVNNIKIYRKWSGITQSEMADILGMHRNTYNRKENGEKKFSETEIQEIIKALNLSEDDLKTSISENTVLSKARDHIETLMLQGLQSDELRERKFGASLYKMIFDINIKSETDDNNDRTNDILNKIKGMFNAGNGGVDNTD